MQEKLDLLKKKLSRVDDLLGAIAVLGWDQDVLMPEGGAAARADQRGTLSALAHEYFVDEEVGALLEELAPWAEELDYESDDASLVRVRMQDYLQQIRVPSSWVEEESKATSLGRQAWVKARAENDVSLFEPHREKLVDLQIQWAGFQGSFDNPYDPLLNKFERGLTYENIGAVFSGLKPNLIELVAAIV